MQSGLINLYTDFESYGGAQNVSISLHKGLKHGEKNILMGLTDFQDLNNKYPVLKTEEYLKFSIKNIKKHKDFIFISHHRKITTYLCIINRLLFLNLKIVHVAHNEFYSLKFSSIFPRMNIAVSNRVKENLQSYFSIKEDRVTTIYNGLEDTLNQNFIKSFNSEKVRILYPARINNIKQQVEIVKRLRGKLDRDISIHFAGTGDSQKELEDLCRECPQFEYLGFRDIKEIIENYDFVMLFSKNEGLPLTLIESCMYQKPILTNNVGGNLEILEDGVNGFELSEFANLHVELNKLKNISPKQYENIATNARETFLSKFTYRQMMARYQDILKSFD